MQHIITAEQMRQAEARAVEKGISREMLMEEAGKKIAEHAFSFVQTNSLKPKALVLAGKGNNGGDAYVAARHLLQLGLSVVVWQAFEVAPDSLLKKVKRRYEARGGKVLTLTDSIPHFPEDGIIIDGLFGTGFHGQIDSKTQALMQTANQSGLPILSIDIPSGIDAASGTSAEGAIIATETIAIECPKIGYFLQSAMCNIGRLVSYSIGLQEFITEPPTVLALGAKEAALLLPKIVRTRHKYQAGHVVGLAGSHGMAGAALLASWSCLHSGAGIVRLLHPEKHSCEFSGVPLEVVRVPYETAETARHTIEKASTLFIGPGLGSETVVLDSVWPVCKQKKCVLDADAIHWIANKQLPLENAIITPHLGECAKLLGKDRIECVTMDLLNEVQAFADKNKTHIILKGAPTFLFSPSGPIYTVLHGDPGMATAGSGDVLTGILAGLLSQGLHPLEAMQLGVWLHSRAGELAADTHSSYSVTATSIMNHIGPAYKELQIGQFSNR